MNSEIVKTGMLVLTGREKVDVVDAVSWCRLLLERWWSRMREKAGVVERKIEAAHHWNQYK
jgi:hypothetical protein